MDSIEKYSFFNKICVKASVHACMEAHDGWFAPHPRDLRRALADPKGNLRLYLSLDELERLVEYAITGYNGTPHSGLNNATPLEAMEYLYAVHKRRTCVEIAAL